LSKIKTDSKGCHRHILTLHDRLFSCLHKYRHCFAINNKLEKIRKGNLPLRRRPGILKYNDFDYPEGGQKWQNNFKLGPISN
jgi:hypothetical protein